MPPPKPSTRSSPRYLIANPIYDSVFKRLLADLELARLLLSVLLGLEIVSLRFASQEIPAKAPLPGSGSASGTPPLSAMRLDFCAVIRTVGAGCRQVLIELQKSRLSGDVLRFRRYLAERYTVLEEIVRGDGSIRNEALPILSVYLFGFEIDPRLPVVTRVERRYVDGIGGTELVLPGDTRPAWIEGLTHDAWFIQIPKIRGIGQGRSSLERLLSVFDQSLQVQGDAHRLDYAPRDGKLEGDELLQRVLRRLHKLQADPEMERIMSAEDVFELEQKRIHEDLTTELRRELAESERRREEEQRRREEEQRIRIEAEQEIARLRKLLEDQNRP
jgi:hypothetical protein